MKKLFIIGVYFAGLGYGFAQANPQEADQKTWYHKDFATTNVYGINTDNAYKFLESKGLKPKTVVVGVLDSGVQVDHPGLAPNMWKNPNEVPNNGKDDDGNGYVDDIYGWNFLGSKNVDINADNLEVTRVIKAYKPIFEGADSAANKANQASKPEEFEMYMKSKKIFAEKSVEAQQGYRTYQMIEKIIPNIAKLVGENKFTTDLLSKLTPTSQEDAIALQVLSQASNNPEILNKNGKEIGDFLSKDIKDALDYFKNQAEFHYNLDYDPRAEKVGDNYNDYTEKSYGNNNYEGPDALHGSHVAGIIAGVPQGKENQYGVAYKVAKILTVRTVPDGDERDKDVANAIKYAVDNGAKIINMSFGKAVSPGKKHVWDAFKYAESKNVLLVKAAGNDNEDLAVHSYFPTNYKNVNDESPLVSNMIVVGASTNDNSMLRADFSNYNKKLVDVFAPGAEIYSTIPKSIYKFEQGTSMASPVVAGAAAVLLAYMPNLTPAQIKEALVKTVNKSSANSFADNSNSGGVIDLKKAAVYAFENFYSKNKNTPSKKSNSKSTSNIKKSVKK